jgi:hypothetical protein
LHLFRSLVKNYGLFDLGYNGPAYTWCNKRYSSKPLYERLDRFLANAEWSNLFPNVNIYNLPILQGDHAPVMAVLHSKFKKPTYYFKFENWWLLEDDFQETAMQARNTSKNQPFTTRTKHHAGALKNWRKKKKPLQNQLNDIEQKIKEIQEKPIQEQDHNEEEKLIISYDQTMTRLTEYYKQRAKKHWAIHGDKNTRYFHNSVLKRRRRNRIVSINNTKGQTTLDPEEIAQCFVSYFKNIFSSSTTTSMGQTPHVLYTGIIQDDYTNSTPDKEEIWSILKEMRNEASPGPDGLNAAFYKAAWNWIGDDITKLVQNFYHNGYLPQQLNETSIALIPKKLHCSTPQDFRPISLCNVIYKIIAKSLANRMKPHLPNRIIDAQQAFIEGRRISNNVIVAQEITHSFSLSSWKHQAFMIKIDLAKAFDRIEWDFIFMALQNRDLVSTS